MNMFQLHNFNFSQSYSVGVTERVDVFILAAAEYSAAVDHGQDDGGHCSGPQTWQQIVVDEESGQHCGLRERSVDLGEVEEEPEEHQ